MHLSEILHQPMFFSLGITHLEQQYYLMVGSYKKNVTDGTGGVLRFYKFSQATGELTLVNEYTGFGRIKDVVYRER